LLRAKISAIDLQNKQYFYNEEAMKLIFKKSDHPFPSSMAGFNHFMRNMQVQQMNHSLARGMLLLLSISALVPFHCRVCQQL